MLHRTIPPFLLALVCDRTLADGLVEDHAASWRAVGLDDTLAGGRENALPPSLLEAVAAAAPAVRVESIGDAFKFGKHNTWWFPLYSSDGSLAQPRSAIEAAVITLFQLDFGDALTPVIGAEWWFQEQKGPAEGIGFHYDKDEAFASEHMTMRFPEVSTVTYLSEAGAPTLVFNQTTPDGNEEVPPLPRDAWVVHPRQNRHLVFRGNLHHGTAPDLSLHTEGAPRHAETPNTAPRRTLLINFWRTRPMPPNCAEFELSRWKKLSLALDAGTLQALVERPSPNADDADAKAAASAAAKTAANAAAKTAQTADLPPIAWSSMALESGQTRRMVVTVAPNDLLFFDVPKPSLLKPGAWHMAWDGASAAGPIAHLDLQHQRGVSALFRDTRPKFFVVLRGGIGGALWADELPPWLGPLQLQYEAELKFSLADPDETADFLNAFSLSASTPATAVIHDTHHPNGEKKHRLKGALNAESARRFIVDFLAARGGGKKDEL